MRAAPCCRSASGQPAALSTSWRQLPCAAAPSGLCWRPGALNPCQMHDLEQLAEFWAPSGLNASAVPCCRMRTATPASHPKNQMHIPSIKHCQASNPALCPAAG